MTVFYPRQFKKSSGIVAFSEKFLDIPVSPYTVKAFRYDRGGWKHTQAA
jgi:hypothetical protein